MKRLTFTFILLTSLSRAQNQPPAPSGNVPPSGAPGSPATPSGSVAPDRSQVPPRPPMPEEPLVSPVGDVGERVQKLHETVGLTDDQQKKLKIILTKNDEAMKAAIAAWRTSHTSEDRQKLREILTAQNAAISAILTDAQKQKGRDAARPGFGGRSGPADGAGQGAGSAGPVAGSARPPVPAKAGAKSVPAARTTGTALPK